jgi:hypothetical protein
MLNIKEQQPNDYCQIFYTIDKAREYMKEKSEQPLFLFSKDFIPNEQKKRYIVTTQDTLFKNYGTNDHNLYENINVNKKIKLFIDLDIKLEDLPENANIMKVYKETYSQITYKISESLKEKYGITDYQVITITSHRKDKNGKNIKASAHCVYKNIVFENVNSLGYFMADMKIDENVNKFVDKSVYGNKSLRMVFNSKLGLNNPLVLNSKKCENYEYTNDKDLFFDCLLHHIEDEATLVPFVNHKAAKKELPTKINDSKTYGNKLTISKTHTMQTIPIETIKLYASLITGDYLDDYMKWLYVGMAIHNSNPSEEAFDLWDKISQKSRKYSNKYYNMAKWNSFKFTPMSINYIKHVASVCNKDEYQKIVNVTKISDKEKVETIKTEYLLKKGEHIKNSKSDFSKLLREWIDAKESEKKMFMLKSPYDTGKTYMLRTLLKEYMSTFKRVLFLTHRQSLANEFHKDFGGEENNDVDCYLDKLYSSNKIICSIESMPILYTKYCEQTPYYDLIIIDESESILNHFSSTTIQNSHLNFEIISEILKKGKKIIMMDGDIGKRSIDFAKEFGKIKIVHNTIKKNVKKFIFTERKKDFYKSIDDDLKNGKKIVITSLSCDMLYYFDYMYSNEESLKKTNIILTDQEKKKRDDVAKKYKGKNKNTVKVNVLLHTSKTSDELKALMGEDLEALWKWAQLLMYSPTITSGVSFNYQHYDKLYVILAQKSCNPRDCLQMCSRVRQFTCNDICVFTNKMQFGITKKFIEFDDAEREINDIFHNHLKKVNNDNNLKPFDGEIYDKIMAHNMVENMNSTQSLFIPYLISMLEEKGHTYEYIKRKTAKELKLDRKNDDEKIVDVKYKDILVETDDITNEQAKKLIAKNNDNKMNEKEKKQLDRFMFIHTYKKMIWKKQFNGKCMFDDDFDFKQIQNPLYVNELEDDCEYETLSPSEIKAINKKNNDLFVLHYYGKKQQIDSLIYFHKMYYSDVNEKYKDKLYYETEECGLKYDKKMKNEKVLRIEKYTFLVDFVKKFGHEENLTTDKKLDADDFEKKVQNILANSMVFKQKEKMHLLFGIKEGRIDKIYENYIVDKDGSKIAKKYKEFLGFANKLLGTIGVEIKYERSDVWNKEGKKNKKVNIYHMIVNHSLKIFVPHENNNIIEK